MSGEAIRPGDFARMFRLEGGPPPAVTARCKTMNLAWREPTIAEFSDYVLDFLRILEQKRVPRTRDENLAAFEAGWEENLLALRAAGPEAFEEALRPRYFRDTRFLRHQGGVIVPENPQIEHDAFLIARLCLFSAWLGQASTIVELGCGSCANLLLLARLFPETRLIGLDWTTASGEIAKELARRVSPRLSGGVLDLLAPEDGPALPPGAAVITIHAFEQLGVSFGPALDWILRAKPSLVLQYEPVLDFYDRETLPDHLALDYCTRRNYLQGYLGRLRALEAQGVIRLLAAYRPGLGGVLHEASVLVWQPVS